MARQQVVPPTITGADLHHRVRHHWLDRLAQLQLAADDLHASGESVIGRHRQVSVQSRQAVRIGAANSFGS